MPPPTTSSSAPKHKVEFLGDSITAGFDNQCDIKGSPKGFPWSESFIKSWATGICDALDAECHYNAWSGFGMVANCCGGSTLAHVATLLNFIYILPPEVLFYIIVMSFSFIADIS